jgi:hypothetical protein
MTAFALTLSGTTYNTELQVASYGGGNPALLALDAETGENVATLSVNLVDSPSAPLCVWIKDWSENTGAAAQLEASGLATPTGRTASSGFVTGIREFQLGEELAVQFLAQMAGSDL